MGLRQNIGAISKLALVLLLLISAIVGAFFTYLWVEGYYYSLDLQVPEKTSITITNATFPVRSTFSFNVTILNPSFSPSRANLTQIAALTRDGVANITLAEPLLPSQLSRGESKTFNCEWNWANYTGQNITIVAFTSDGTGATFQVRTPLVKLEITNMSLDRFEMTEIAPFNITIQNSELSATKVNVTEIRVASRDLEGTNVTLPYMLNRGAKVTVTGTWNWTGFDGENIEVVVNTAEGYAAYITKAIPSPTPVVAITDVLLDPTDTNHFNITIQNNKLSTRFISVRAIIITMENGTTREIEQVVPSLEPAYIIEPGNSTSFKCTWNWTDYRNKNVTITVRTLQEYTAKRTVITPALIGSFGELAASPFFLIAILSINWIGLLSKPKQRRVKAIREITNG